MKKTYLAPMSETLSAILKNICGDAGVDPGNVRGASGNATTGTDSRWAPIRRM